MCMRMCVCVCLCVCVCVCTCTIYISLCTQEMFKPKRQNAATTKGSCGVCVCVCVCVSSVFCKLSCEGPPPLLSPLMNHRLNHFPGQRRNWEWAKDSACSSVCTLLKHNTWPYLYPIKLKKSGLYIDNYILYIILDIIIVSLRISPWLLSRFRHIPRT